MAKAKESAATEAKAKAEAKRDALLDADAKDSPVLSLITKRLRAARKKIKKVEEIEAIKASGREINTDQVALALKTVFRLFILHHRSEAL